MYNIGIYIMYIRIEHYQMVSILIYKSNWAQQKNKAITFFVYSVVTFLSPIISNCFGAVQLDGSIYHPALN